MKKYKCIIESTDNIFLQRTCLETVYIRWQNLNKSENGIMLSLDDAEKFANEILREVKLGRGN